MKIASNIKYLRELKNLSQESMADELGMTRSRLGAYEEARNEPPIEILIRISDYFHVSIDALVRADLRKTKGNAIMKIGDNRMLFPIVIDNDNNDKIEVITGKASAGYITGYADPEYIEKMPVMELPFSAKGKQRAFPIIGDSMPPLETGDYVVGKFVESMKDVTEGKSYILLTKNDGIVYKRIMKKANTTLELHSDNKEYEPFSINKYEVLELWEFTCSVKKSDSKNEEINLESVMNLMREMKTEINQLKKR